MSEIKEVKEVKEVKVFTFDELKTLTSKSDLHMLISGKGKFNILNKQECCHNKKLKIIG